MLKVKNLSKNYKTGTNEVKALNNVTINFGEKGMILISGKSGSGKSTLLNLLGGLDKPTSGELIINGLSSAAFKESDFDAYRNTCIGFIFQEYNLIENYSVGENVSLALELQGKPAKKEIVNEILKKLNLIDATGETLYNRKINELSGGQKQRVAVARALIKNPEIILADEPTGALDSQTAEQLYNILKELSKERLVIVVSHDKEKAGKYADRIIELSDGKIDNDSNCCDFIEAVETPRKFIKGRLPFKRIFLLGVSGLKHKTFRLILSVILAVCSFTFFGFSTTASSTDVFSAELRTLYENNKRITILEPFSNYKSALDGSKVEYKIFSQKQLEEIKNFTGKDIIPVVNDYFCPSYIKNLAVDINDFYFSPLYQNNPYIRLCLRNFDKVIELDYQTGELDAELKPDSRLIDKTHCRLPIDETEIAITDLKANTFMKFGYISDLGEKINIKTPDDLIGKTLDGLTICGIYSTMESLNTLQQFDKVLDGNDRFMQFYLEGTHIINFAFVCKSYTAKKFGLGNYNDISGVLYKLSGNQIKDKDLFRTLTYNEYKISHYYQKEFKEQYFYSAKINSEYSGFAAAAQDYLPEEVVYIILLISIMLAIFSVLLFINFLLVGIDCRKKEMGILRAIGARSIDTVIICLVESAIVAIIDFILSLVGVLILCLLINKFFYISLFFVGPLQIFVLFALCIVGTALSAILPAMKIAKKKPIDVINNI